MAERARVNGEVAFLLEPDLKESRGGLRDITAVRALATAWVADPPSARRAGRRHACCSTCAANCTGAPAATGCCCRSRPAIAEALGTARLRRPRAQRRRCRPHDRVRLEHRLVPRVAQPSSRAAGVAASVVRRGLDEGVVEHDGEVDAGRRRRPGERSRAGAAGRARRRRRRPADHAAHPGAAGDRKRAAAGAVAARGARGLRRDARRRAARPSPSSRRSTTPGSWCACCRTGSTCAAGRSATRITASPSIATSSKPRRTRPRSPATVSRPDLLLVGTLLHDIGKGLPGDHSVVGAELAGTHRHRHGLRRSRYGAALVTIARHHLLLPDTATRRDLEDPATAEFVASVVERSDGASICSPPSPRPTAEPPDRRRGRPGRRS